MTSTKDRVKLLTDKCINCGFCEAVCPTLEASTFKAAIGARGRVMIAKEMLSELDEKNLIPNDFLDSFYSCLDCSACLTVCPAGISAGEISQLSRNVLVSDSKETKKVADMIVKVTMKYGSPLGLSGKINSWFEGMKFYDKSEVLFYTGQMFLLSAYSKTFSRMEMSVGGRATDIGASIVSKVPFLMKMLSFFIRERDSDTYRRSIENIHLLLTKAGIRMSRLENEPYPGTFLLDLGYENEFKEYATRLCAVFRKKGTKRIITTDPHTYDLLKYSYPKHVQDFDFEVLFYTDLLDNIKFNRVKEKIIFHEPCHLVRGSKQYGKPLEILTSAYDVLLPAKNGAKTACCGGPDELLYPGFSEKISERRYRELRDLGDQLIATACPICLSNLTKDNRVIDISEALTKASS